MNECPVDGCKANDAVGAVLKVVVDLSGAEKYTPLLEYIQLMCRSDVVEKWEKIIKEFPRYELMSS